MADQKTKIIEETYNNFFGSIANTFKDAKKRDPTITMADVKAFNNNFVRKGISEGITATPPNDRIKSISSISFSSTRRKTKSIPQACSMNRHLHQIYDRRAGQRPSRRMTSEKASSEPSPT
jgi:hypothetical protein